MKKILLVVDMQKDFVDGSLGTPEAQTILSNVSKKVKEYRSNGYPIVFTQDTHGEDYLDTQEGKILPVMHCVFGTIGWELHEDLNVKLNDEIITKSTFGDIDIIKSLSPEQDDEIEIIGLCTDVCVVSNALLAKTLHPEIKIAVDAACCAGVTPETHKAALTTMKMCQISIVNEVFS